MPDHDVQFRVNGAEIALCIRIFSLIIIIIFFFFEWLTGLKSPSWNSFEVSTMIADVEIFTTHIFRLFW